MQTEDSIRCIVFTKSMVEELPFMNKSPILRITHCTPISQINMTKLWIQDELLGLDLQNVPQTATVAQVHAIQFTLINGKITIHSVS